MTLSVATSTASVASPAMAGGNKLHAEEIEK